MLQTTLITIFRNEEAIEVSVDVRETYRGTNDFDDPNEVDSDEYGYTKEGKAIELSESEQAEAVSNLYAITPRGDLKREVQSIVFDLAKSKAIYP